MLIAERRRRIIEQVRRRGYASFRELADALGTSESTVRRDLRLMVAEGLLQATRGGVSIDRPDPRGAAAGGLPDARAHDGADGAGLDGAGQGGAGLDGAGLDRPLAGNGLRVFDPSAGTSDADPVYAQREAIAAHAASLVQPGSAVLLGPGRTTYALARRLVAVGPLTVVTNSLRVTEALAGAAQVDVVMVGGALRRSIGALVGPITEQNLQTLRGTQVFLSGDGVTVDRGLTTPNVFAAATDQAFAAAARQVVVLADDSKIGRDTMCQTVPTDRIGVLVTGSTADPSVLRGLGAAGVDIHLVDA